MSGFENIDNLLRVTITLISLSTIVGGFIIRYLSQIKKTSTEVKEDFNKFKHELDNKIVSLANKIEIMDGKLKDSYSKAESDNRLLSLKGEIVEKMYQMCNQIKQKITGKKEGE